MTIPRRAFGALALFAAWPAAPSRAASLPGEASALLARLPAPWRQAHAAVLFPRLADPFTVARQHAEGWASNGAGRFGLAAPPLALPEGALAVVFGTEAAMRPLLHAGAWEAGTPAAGAVLGVSFGAEGASTLELPRGLRLFRLAGLEASSSFDA